MRFVSIPSSLPPASRGGFAVERSLRRFFYLDLPCVI